MTQRFRYSEVTIPIKRYHLCLVSYFLTTDDILERADRALKEIKRTLPPGGILKDFYVRIGGHARNLVADVQDSAARADRYRGRYGTFR
jgi:hypothetical protein